MDPTALRDMLPVGATGTMLGVSIVLLVYLLRVIFGDRKQAGIDRAAEREDYRQERAALIEQHAKEKRDLEDYWRRRCQDAEEAAGWRKYGADEDAGS